MTHLPKSLPWRPLLEIMLLMDALSDALEAIELSGVIFLRGEDYFAPVLLGYGVAVVVWAFLAESVASRVERREPAQGMDRLAQRDPRTKLPI